MVNEFLWNQFLILFPDVKSQNYFNRVQVWQKTIFSANITNLGKTRSTMITSSSLPFNSSLGYPVPACLHFEYGHRLLPPEINQSINQSINKSSENVLFDWAANRKEGKYLQQPMRTKRTTKLPKARENVRDQVVSGFSFTSDWSRKWWYFSKPITKRIKPKPGQFRITFDTIKYGSKLNRPVKPVFPRVLSYDITWTG